jgi:U3 small nucleolar RNA-associated protein 22
MWSHLFSGVVSDEVVELLVAYTFVKSAPNGPPSSRVTGFLRFLLLLVHYDWALAPLVVDVNGDFTTADLDRIVVCLVPYLSSPCIWCVCPCCYV